MNWPNAPHGWNGHHSCLLMNLLLLLIVGNRFLCEMRIWIMRGWTDAAPAALLHGTNEQRLIIVMSALRATTIFTPNDSDASRARR